MVISHKGDGAIFLVESQLSQFLLFVAGLAVLKWSFVLTERKFVFEGVNYPSPPRSFCIYVSLFWTGLDLIFVLALWRKGLCQILRPGQILLSILR